MDYLTIKAFLGEISLQTIIIAFCCAIISKLIEKIIKKQTQFTQKYLAFILAVIFYAVYHVIMVEDIILTKLFTQAFVCGFLSVVSKSIITKIENKQSLSFFEICLVKDIIKDIVSVEQLNSITDIILSVLNSSESQEEKTTKIADAINENSNDDTDKLTAEQLAVKIIKAFGDYKTTK